jgi:phage FluMu gp28-like protein
MSQPPFKLHTRQRAWVEDTSRFKAGMMARQCGKTSSSTLEIVDDCLDAEVNGGSRRWVILSRGERQAREAINEGIRRHYATYNAAFEALEVDWDGCEDKALEVALPNGSRITGLPANPDTARGFTANVLLDEFAFHADSRKIWGALFPVISRGDLKLRVISTPNGKSNKFYEIMTAGSLENELRETGHVDAGVWSLHFCNIYDAVAGGLDRNIDELKEGLNDDELWDQEFLLLWLDEATAWLDYDLINAAEHDKAGIPEQYAGGLCYAGVDIGRRRDLFVIWVDELIGDVAWCREIIARRRIKFAEQDALLDDVMRRYRIARLCMDQTGMGEKPVEDAQRRYGEYLVEGVLMTGPMKQHLATVGKQSFEDRKSRIPLGNRDVRGDLHSLKRIILPSGAHRFDADRSENGHADRAWAKFLATYAASSPYQPYAYHAATAAAIAEARRRGELEDEAAPLGLGGGFRAHAGVI